MRLSMATVIVAGTALTSSVWAEPQGTVIQQLQAKYPVTAMDANGIKVATPGAILVVQLDGVMVATKGRLSGIYYNEFKNGVIGPDTSLVHSQLNMRAFNPHPLAIGDKVYLLKLDSSSNSITFRFQSCGTCNPKAVDPGHQPSQGELTFKFVKGGLQGTDFNQVKQVIDQVMKLNDEVQAATANSAQAPPPATGRQSGSQLPATQPPPPPPVDDPPPPPPPADPGPRATGQAQTTAPPMADDPPPQAPPAQLKLGMSVDQVKAALGSPDTILDKGASVDSKGVKASTLVYIYKSLKVTFKNGKVIDFE